MQHSPGSSDPRSSGPWVLVPVFTVSHDTGEGMTLVKWRHDAGWRWWSHDTSEGFELCTLRNMVCKQLRTSSSFSTWLGLPVKFIAWNFESFFWKVWTLALVHLCEATHAWEMQTLNWIKLVLGRCVGVQYHRIRLSGAHRYLAHTAY